MSKSRLLVVVAVLLACVFIGVANSCEDIPEPEPAEWWKNSIIYQIYPRSYKDGNGDGIGDLNGIISKLEHISDIGAKALWLSPIYESPQVDFGYDISNFTAIDPTYGTLDDFTKLVSKAKSLGLKVLLDLVPNHSSDQHPWFKKSIKKEQPYDEYYIWRDAKIVNGTRQPPNNWLSIFGGPSWTWNEERKQYYYHQFASAQPDLNYRYDKLRQEMEDVITFWLDRGVDGFRIDAVIHMFEDQRLLDEPLSNNPNAKPNEYEYLLHPYTKDQNETYDVMKRWRELMDAHAAKAHSGPKYAIVEAGSPIPLMMKYYSVGVDPFNFMFTGSLNRDSKASDFEKEINTWLDNMPQGQSANWVIGNHDNSRAASRFGKNGNRADQLTMLASILPGIMVIYNGDEIGMLDRKMTWEETVDPAGCNAGKERYELKSRDPARTPFQWDATTSAGFSTNTTTWLPVNDNYKTLNLEAQKKADKSHYKIFLDLALIKQTSLQRTGELEVARYKDDVLAVVRRLPNRTPLVVLINFTDSTIQLNLRQWLDLPENIDIYVASVSSGLKDGRTVKSESFVLPGAATVILAGKDLHAY